MTLNWKTLTGPTVLVDKQKATRNISRMADKAKSASVALRPHFKTHQSELVGRWFEAAGTRAIAVSSVPMAAQFADAGWNDILIAIPLNPRELPMLNRLATKLTLGVTVEHIDALKPLQKLTAPVNLMVEIDAGYGRTGIDWREHQRIDEILQRAHDMSQVQQLGLLLHAGNSYNARGDENIAEIHQQSLERLAELVETLNFPREQLVVSVGDTPTCSRMDEFPGADEIRPGNYVFYDLMQYHIGACDWQDVALAMACPVIARYPERGEVVVHGGAVHFSKDFIEIDGQPVFGQVMRKTADGWGAPVKGAVVKGLSQEHGKVKLPEGMINELQLGDMLVIVPAHSCLTMDAMRDFVVCGGHD